ncbi:PREDICTED: breast carcinoma-amplified sequence 3-like [Priapulus caudatus]|uniref:Breast carcinoma-amplified sequence 3-like n=1 Tax=Priapulus caudatus TaxID=37621 RepID=A0ABM1F0V3_PRICU|nr:PREDICTED: breast carcinoma-amplified sequence 3-like [Priapulus caudatus]
MSQSIEFRRHIYYDTKCIKKSLCCSDKSVVESFVGFIQDVVPQAYSGTQRTDEREKIVWAKFERCDINDPKLRPEIGHPDGVAPPLLLVIGYVNGVQLWCLMSTGDAQEVLSLRQGPVKVLKVLPTPEPVFGVEDAYAESRPLVAICDSSSAGPPYCSVCFVSLKTGNQVKSIKFQSPVVDIACHKRVVVVTFREKIAVFDACTFRERFCVTSCYPAPGPIINPIALATRWLAYSDKRLVPMHQSCGGVTGDGVQSYAATVISAAKTITKGLTIFGETVASSLTGAKAAAAANEKSSRNDLMPGVVTIVDIQTAQGEVIAPDIFATFDGRKTAPGHLYARRYVHNANLLNNSMNNPAGCPPYPHQRTVQKSNGSPTTFTDPICVTAYFAPTRGWFPGSALPREDQSRHFDSLYVFGCNGILVEHPLEPRAPPALTKLTEDSPLDLNLSTSNSL